VSELTAVLYSETVIDIERDKAKE